MEDRREKIPCLPAPFPVPVRFRPCRRLARGALHSGFPRRRRRGCRGVFRARQLLRGFFSLDGGGVRRFLRGVKFRGDILVFKERGACCLSLIDRYGGGGFRSVRRFLQSDRRALQRADMLYSEIDRNKLFKGTVAEEDRSVMNICFVMNEEYAELEKPFFEFATSKGMVGIKGHRSVGGFRASCYNAQTVEGVQALIDAMKEFEANH